MITEDYVNFEIAKLLKEKGFDEPCRSYYIGSSGRYSRCAVEIRTINCASDEILRPTFQMVLKWLREEKNLSIQTILDSWALGRHSGYYIVIQDTNSDFEEISPRVNEEDTVFFSTHEEAVEAAIKYTLENLI